LLDIVFAVILVLAIIKGYQRGLIVGVFSFIAVIIGLAAAMKLSAVAARYLEGNTGISPQWLPIISFALVFLLVVLIIRLCANLIQRTVEFAMLGWVNRLGGILLYAVIFITVFSVLVFYADEMNLLTESAKENSLSYTFIQPWGPGAINTLGAIVPLFRDMFQDLQLFFAGMSGEAQAG
jgi:membrane protein required for colicin V production